MALLISPVVGFVCAGLLLLLAKALIKSPTLFSGTRRQSASSTLDSGLADARLHGGKFRSRF